jgi:ribosomal protein S18 acetylase RimI-like enzyme
MSALRQATEADLPVVARVLAEAFADDPVKCFLIRSTPVPVARNETFFNVFGGIQLAHGHVYLTVGGEAAAVWAPPDAWKIPFSKVARHSPTFIRLYGRRFLPNLGVLNAMERAHPTAPHYYLEFIGTSPAHQGKGHGSALINPMLDRADEEGVGMYLESSKDTNVPYYRRFGFEVTRTLVHRGRNAPTMWLMWRDPR